MVPVGQEMTLPHPLASASKRNERKALLYAKWVSMGSVAVCFDATAAEVAVPEQYKESIDIYFTVSDQDTKILPNGLEGVCTSRIAKIRLIFLFRGALSTAFLATR